MAGSILPIEGKVVASVVNPPDVGVVVKFNGQSMPAILSLGKSEDVQFGNFTVSIEAVDIIYPKPSEVAVWLWTMRSTIGTGGDKVRVIRSYLCMDQSEALEAWAKEFPDTTPRKISQSLPPIA
jgi:hypothetical protein